MLIRAASLHGEPPLTLRPLAAPAAFAAVLALLFAALPAQAASVWTATSTEKIRPAAPARAPGGAALTAARNEFEAFQVVITGAATGVRATTAGLTGPASLPVRLYREAIIHLANPSALDGGTGPWPDALVPDVDELTGERRNAFPFAVPAGESRAVWVEVHVPPDAPAGEYAGSVQVTWDGGEATVPVTLTVWPFTLPSTASLKSAFGLSWGTLNTAHGVSGDALSTLRGRYGQLALDHRVTLSRIDDGNRDLAHFASFFGPLFDGGAATSLPGAQATSVEYLGGSSGYASWASFFQSRGWDDRLFQYTCDEPPLQCAWGDIPARAASARAVSPALRTLVTTTVQQADAAGVTSSIDVLVPVVNFLDDRAGERFAGPQRAAYDAFLAGSPRREVWTYQSCMSHGCGGTVDMGSPSDSDRYFTGWPSYMIDASAVRNRAMEWISFNHRVTGELYYETTMAYSHDPWNNQWDFSGNGDGTLFYPGTPAKVGGTTQIPVASIRLKMIREGMEDYEYLKLLTDLGDGALAREISGALFPHPYDAEVSPADLLAARERIARRIVELGGGAPGAPGSGTGSGSGGGGAGGGLQAGVIAPSGCRSGAGGLLALLGLAGAVRRRRR
ncbi:conserved hypothetical protein [Anaeromyxobacter dehalogenans 2CP-1]|uniref:Uncharacterized protein n=1 Tax=Anaeromyxobacter dehalogenans (strain ATCC BAA-258 / DSM 21875 / 2CP-1) TaxID=455488 RepID=B8JAQ2_ANAD2|nr:DUF4091 domain-containing protein [Anaeromyxobacter dehalogenans]ACL67551.1 conserved hypothetical protein [Anaeromyxobacter dehalogenans 2CP-1]